MIIFILPGCRQGMKKERTAKAKRKVVYMVVNKIEVKPETL